MGSCHLQRDFGWVAATLGFKEKAYPILGLCQLLKIPFYPLCIAMSLASPFNPNAGTLHLLQPDKIAELSDEFGPNFGFHLLVCFGQQEDHQTWMQ